MNKQVRILYCLAIFMLLFSCVRRDLSDNPVELVDPFTGTDMSGNLYPGAVLPFGNYPGYGNLLVIPQAGQLDILNKTSKLINEKAEPGYYSATFVNGNIKSEVTAFEKAGFHKYTFSDTGQVHIIIDPSASLTGSEDKEGKSTCKICEVTIMPDNKIRGYSRFEGGRGGINPYDIYFIAEFDQSFGEFGIWNKGIISKNEISIQEQSEDSISLGAYVSLNIKAGDKIKLKIALSCVSYEKAQTNLDEASSWEFIKIKNRASGIWQDHLKKISVEGGTKDQNTVFYTALYHSMVIPCGLSGENPSQETGVPGYWDFLSNRSTFKTANPLLMLIFPELRSFQARDNDDNWLNDSIRDDGLSAPHLMAKLIELHEGLPGQNMSGLLSEWYVWSAMGIYPIAGQDIYLIGSPLFSKTTIDIGDGNKFVIRALNNSFRNKYVLSASLNGKQWNKAWFRYEDIINGAELVLIMGPEPYDWGKDDPPPSLN